MFFNRLSAMEVDCGEGCFCTLKCLTSGLEFRGNVTMRMDFKGNWPVDGSKLNGLNSAFVCVNEREWFGYGSRPVSRYQLSKLPLWCEWDLDTSIYPDGEYTLVLHVYRMQLNPKKTDGSLYTGNLPAGFATCRVVFHNDSTINAVVPDMAEVVVPQNGTLGTLDCKYFTCGGVAGGPIGVTTEPTFVGTSEKLTGSIECVDSVGRRGLVRVTVQDCLPHFTKNGKISTSYVEGQSVIPCAFLPSPAGDLHTGPWWSDAHLEAGMNTAGIGFLPYDPKNGYSTELLYKKELDRQWRESIQPFIDKKFMITINGDHLMTHSALQFYLESDANMALLKYAIKMLADSGVVVSIRGKDETANAWSDQPTQIKPGGTWSYNPGYPLVTYDGICRVIEEMRSVDSCPAIGHAGGGPNWATDALADFSSNFAYPIPTDVIPTDGPCVWQYRESWRRGYFGDVKFKWKGWPADKPRESLMVATKQHYFKKVPGNKFQPGDELLRNGLSVLGAIVQVGLAIIAQSTQWIFYFPESNAYMSEKGNAIISTWGNMTELQTGLSPCTPEYYATQNVLRWVGRNLKYVLARPISCLSLGPGWDVCARENMVFAINISGKPLPLPSVPKLIPQLNNPDIITPFTVDVDQRLGRMVDYGHLVAWKKYYPN